MTEETIILVDEKDREIGTEKKQKAHQNGAKLHRAFSAFVFNSDGRMMLHLRARPKYHGGGLWTNACCGHPRPGETTDAGMIRRLKEEMGFMCPLKEITAFEYRAPNVGNGLTEHEYDHIFFGTFDGEPKLNPEECEDWKWIDVAEIRKDINKNPQNYTPWFVILFKELDKRKLLK